jgi:hypothetical protein
MLSTSLAVDLHKTFLNPTISQRRSLSANRVSSVTAEEKAGRQKGSKPNIDNALSIMKVSRTSHSRVLEGLRNIGHKEIASMKKLAIGAGCLLASLSIFAQGPQTYKGEIIDSQCAALGGHQIMEQKGESAKDCTNRCVNMGGKYTLFDPATKTAYQLDDQKKSAAFAGAKVTVTGTLNATTKTIHVTSIKAGA